jgi:hypothetical protein
MKPDLLTRRNAALARISHLRIRQIEHPSITEILETVILNPQPSCLGIRKGGADLGICVGWRSGKADTFAQQPREGMTLLIE